MISTVMLSYIYMKDCMCAGCLCFIWLWVNNFHLPVSANPSFLTHKHTGSHLIRSCYFYVCFCGLLNKLYRRHVGTYWHHHLVIAALICCFSSRSILWWTELYGCLWQLSFYGDEFHMISFKKDTICSHSSNGIEICLSYLLRGKSNLYIAKGKEDICKPSSVNYWGTFMTVWR
jgi:hypothetical protein